MPGPGRTHRLAHSCSSVRALHGHPGPVGGCSPCRGGKNCPRSPNCPWLQVPLEAAGGQAPGSPGDPCSGSLSQQQPCESQGRGWPRRRPQRCGPSSTASSRSSEPRSPLPAHSPFVTWGLAMLPRGPLTLGSSHHRCPSQPASPTGWGKCPWRTPWTGGPSQLWKPRHRDRVGRWEAAHLHLPTPQARGEERRAPGKATSGPEHPSHPAHPAPSIPPASLPWW